MRRVRHPGHKMEGGHLSRAQASTGVAPESRASSHLVPALSGLFHGLLQGRLGGGAPDTALSYMLSNSTVRCGPASLLTLKVGDSKKKPPGGGSVARKGEILPGGSTGTWPPGPHLPSRSPWPPRMMPTVPTRSTARHNSARAHYLRAWAAHLLPCSVHSKVWECFLGWEAGAVSLGSLATVPSAPIRPRAPRRPRAGSIPLHGLALGTHSAQLVTLLVTTSHLEWESCREYFPLLPLGENEAQRGQVNSPNHTAARGRVRTDTQASFLWHP